MNDEDIYLILKVILECLEEEDEEVSNGSREKAIL